MIPFKRLSLSLLGLLAAATTQAATYYVSPSGDDAGTPAQAANPATPWKTIGKAAQTMTAGDTCVIRAGTYRETAVLAASGAAGAPITFKAYESSPGVFEPVTISGTDPVNGWAPDVTTATPNDWVVSLAIPSSSDANVISGDQKMVFRNGEMKPDARWPNAGPGFPWRDSQMVHPSPYTALGDWSYVDAATYTSVAAFRDAQLVAAANAFEFGPSTSLAFLGTTPLPRVHVMAGNGWIMSTPLIKSVSGTSYVTDSANVSTSSPYTIRAGNEYFLSGRKEFLNQEGEWFHDTTAAKLYYYGTTTAPAADEIEVKRRKFGFRIAGKSHVNFQGLNFFACTVETYAATPTPAQATDCTFDSLIIQYPQHNRIVVGQTDLAHAGLVLGQGCVLKNSEVAFASNRLIYLNGSDVQVVNNYLHDSGYITSWPALIDANEEGTNGAYRVERALISHNTILRAGRAAIGYPGRNSVVQYNDVSAAMLSASDGAVLYWIRDGGNTVIKYNRIHDSVGAVGHIGSGIRGLYLDSQNSGWIAHHNLIWNINSVGNTGAQSGFAVQINPRQNYNRFFNNTCYNAQAGMLTTGSSFWGDGPSNTQLYNNIFYNPPPATAQTSLPNSNYDTWGLTDFRNNLFADPVFVDPAGGDFRLSSASLSAIDQGLAIPSVTDAGPQPGVGAPDLGAIESGGGDWRNEVGQHVSLPSVTYANSYEYPAVSPYANLVVDGSFETGGLANHWTATGNVGLLKSDAWWDSHLRTSHYGAQFGGGTSTISQVVSGLIPGKRYKFTCGVQRTDPDSIVTLSVTVPGNPNVFSGVMDWTTGVWNYNVLDPNPMMVELPFINGAGTTVTVKLTVERAAGATAVFSVPPVADSLQVTPPPVSVLAQSGSAVNYWATAYPATGVYADDLAVVLAQDNTDPEPYAMPAVAYNFNEATGATVANDTTTSAASLAATLSGAANFQPGRPGYGNALTLGGTTDGAAAPGVAVPLAGDKSSFTLSFWWKPAEAVANRRLMSNNNGVFNARGWYATTLVSTLTGGILSPGFRFYLFDGTGQAIFTDTTRLDQTKFTHIVVTVDRANRRMSRYRDGRLASMGAIPATFDNVSLDSVTGLSLGAGAAGQLDDFQAWNDVLTAQQVENVYEAGQTAGATPVPTYRLKFDDPAGSTLLWDATGNAAHATVVDGDIVAGGRQGNALAYGNPASTAAAAPAVAVPSTGDGSFTVSFWWNTSVGAASGLIVSNNGDSKQTQGWSIVPGPKLTLRMQLRDGGGGSSPMLATPSFTASVWAHVAYVVDRATGRMTCYVNGLPAASVAVAPFAVDSPAGLTFGGIAHGAMMDDFRLYDQALSPQEIIDLANQLDKLPY